MIDISTADYLDMMNAKIFRYQVGKWTIRSLKEAESIFESNPLAAKLILSRVVQDLTDEIERQKNQQE